MSMPNYLANAALAAVAAALVGCGGAVPKRDVYDAINAQVAGGAAATAASAAPVSELAGTQLPLPTSPKAAQGQEERFNVAFNNAPAQQFFRSIVTGTRYNMLVHPDVTGSISADLKDVTLIETLEAVRDMYGYDYRIDGNRILIKPLTMQTRMFKVNYLIGNRKGNSSLRVASTSVSNTPANGQAGQNNQASEPGAARGALADSTTISTSTANDFWADLKAALEAIVGAGAKDGRRSVVISPQSGVLVVRAMPDELHSVEQYLKATQLSMDRQVILEAKILEVELNDSFQSGINWASFGAFRNGRENRASGGFVSPGATLTPLPPGGGQPAPLSNGGGLLATAGYSLSNAAAGGSMFGLAFQTSNFAALISFLESQGTVHVLSSPRVTAMNNEKAVLKIGTDEFYVTGISTVTNTSASGNVTTPNVTLTPFFSGVVLDVTPQIDDKGNILLHVHPSVSQVSTVNKAINLGSVGNFNLPLAASSTSEIDSMVRGEDGKVIAIGGLMRQSSTADREQIPIVGRLPLLGMLFGNRTQVNQKRELVVLIKPTIVEGANGWDQNLLDANRRIEALDPAGRGRN